MAMNFNSLKISVLALAISATLLVGCGGAEERKSVYMEKAMSSMAAGDYDKARIELKNVLQIDPKDADAHYQLGTVFEKQKDYRKAFSHYLRAEELDKEHLKNLAALAKIYLLMAGEEEKAQEKIDYILSKEPENPDGLLLTAAQHLKNSQADKAKDIAEKILIKHPGHIDTVIFLSTIYINEKNYAAASQVLDVAVGENPGNDQLSKLYGLALVKNNQNQKAEQVYKTLIERNPENVEGYNLLSAFYHQTGNQVQAENTLLQSIDADPGNSERILTYIKYVKAIKGDDAAIGQLESFVEKNKGVGKLRTALAELYVLNNDIDKAIAIYQQAIEDFSEEVTGIESRLSLATIYIQQNQKDKGISVLNDALEISPNDAKLNLLKARLDVADENYEEAVLALRIVTKETPENMEAFLLLANTYRLQGNDEQMASTLNRAYELNRLNADGLMKLAQYQLISEDIEKSLRIIEDYNKLKPDNYQGLSIQAAILNQQKLHAEADTLAQKLIELFPDKPNGYLQAAPHALASGDMDKAISILERGYINVSENRKILILLTRLQGAQKKFDIVEKRLNTELESTPEDTELLGLSVNVSLAKGDKSASIATLRKLIDINNQIEDTYIMLSEIYLSQGDRTNAEQTLIEGRSNMPDSNKIPLKLATLYELEGRYTDSIAIYKTLHNKVPDSPIVTNNLASLLSDHGSEEDLAMARTLVDKLKDLEQPVFIDTVGWVYYKSGDYEKAISFLKQVVEKAPDINIFNFHLGMAYKMAGDNAQAKEYLEKSLADDKPFKQRQDAETALSEL
jgi:putative PEP-CTERM system TPR-repeat lipoprotein